MKVTTIVLISLLVLAIFVAGCKEQSGEATKTLRPTSKSEMTKTPIGGNNPVGEKTPVATSTEKTPVAKTCVAGNYSSCMESSIVTVEIVANCTERELSRVDCSPASCVTSSGITSCMNVSG